jgi:hypothetical protein
VRVLAFLGRPFAAADFLVVVFFTAIGSLPPR